MSADLTLAAIQQHGWRVVLLGVGEKRLPVGTRWAGQATGDPDRIRCHLASGAGIGLDAHASSVTILDFDSPGAAAEMAVEVGPLRLTVQTGSGGFHVYAAPATGLFTQIRWRGVVVGEVLRGPHQQAVMPPSPYPGNKKKGIPPGGHYRWLVDPLEPVPELPAAWLDYLRGTDVPSYFKEGDRRGHPAEEPWGGPPPVELLHRAMQQPGARRRVDGVKFQCAGCAAEGRDRHRDNAKVRLDGRWGCAVNPEHKWAIGAALGVISPDLTPSVPGYDQRMLRRLGFGL